MGSQINFHDLLDLSDAELATYDIAAVNLACALGLPGSENLDISACSRLLDSWADLVRFSTEKCTWFKEKPAKYEYSYNLFRIHVMVALFKFPNLKDNYQRWEKVKTIIKNTKTIEVQDNKSDTGIIGGFRSLGRDISHYYGIYQPRQIRRYGFLEVIE